MYDINFEFEQKGLAPISLKGVPAHLSLLEVAMANQIDLHHNCGGVCACTTCHVYVQQGDELLCEISDQEENYIDRAINPTLQSRLACQAMLLKGGGVVSVKVPDQSQFLGE